MLLAAVYGAFGDMISAGLLAAAATVAFALVQYHRVPTTPGWRRWIPAAIPAALALGADVRAHLDGHTPAGLTDTSATTWLLWTALVLGAFITFGSDVERTIHRAVTSVTGALRTAVAVLLYAVLLIAGLPRLWHRRDPMRTGTATGSTSGWHPAAPSDQRLAHRPFRAEAAPRRRGGPSLARVVGVIVIALAVDYLVGATWGAVAPDAWSQKPATEATVAAGEPASELSTWEHVELLFQDYRDVSATARLGRWVRQEVTGDQVTAMRVAGQNNV